MAVQNIPRPTEEGASQTLIAEAAALAAGRWRDFPPDFFAALYGRAPPDDLERYRPEELAAIGEEAWSFLAERKPGAAKIAFTPARLTPGVTVLDVLNDDMPFLVNSVLGELSERGVDIRFLVHPVLTVERDEAGRLTAFKGVRKGEGRRESFIHIHVQGMDDAAQRAEIVHALEDVLTDVRVGVQDWRPMLARLQQVAADLKTTPPPLPADEVAEAIQFLQWIAADNFTLLGARDYAYTDSEHALEPQFETGLGLLRSHEMRLLRRGNQLVTITPEIREFLQEPKLLIMTKAAVRSRVHRRVHLDYVAVKRFDRDGNLIGECVFCGLLTSTAYTRSVRAIPYLRRKIDAIISRAGFDPSSHSGKALVNVLEHYPRDELFQIDEETLYEFALAVLQLDERPRVRVLPRRDRFDRFVSILVYIPRERYDSQIRSRIGEYLAATFKGRVRAFYPFFPEGPMVRVHFIIGRYEGETPHVDRAVLDHAVEAIVRSWIDGFEETLAAAHVSGNRRTLSAKYREAFPVDYREIYPPATAVADIQVLETLTAEHPLGVELYRAYGAEPTSAGLKVFSHSRPIALSERVPVLENMGFRVVDERTYHIEPQDAADVWFHDMTLESALGQPFDLNELRDKIEACFLAVMGGRAENDGYNALVLATGLVWRDVALIRTLSRFLRQVRVPFSQDYMWATLRKHAAVAAQIVTLFHTRFDPKLGVSVDERATLEATIAAAIETALQAVDSLDEDRILRRFVNAVQCAIRTNFYQLDNHGQPKELIAVKFSSRKLDAMPLPRPLYEIFVYSPRVEGVHLRFGKVARGGIRWSDRPQDFRTEILGLVKAQNVKNAVIVPVGAKGGFVPKRLPRGGAREAIQAEGTASYKLFISTLLDITDNIGTGTTGVVPPRDVVRYEGDDPYLVVAADKGTATFSDIANDIAIAHDFWLGDAFASGGSAGYDHKKMGITARGAWESVKRHFREMDIDIGKTAFTTVGVGDMSGDVFGNGMLRETTTKLVAAFDHRDIFIDPEPDPERTFAERKRLFDLPRSSWQDFDKALISKGGGIYSRSAKEITLSAEARKLLGVSEKLTPQELIKAILKAEVDLLFFGGIGTYIRAADESDEAAGDRANDPIRDRRSGPALQGDRRRRQSRHDATRPHRGGAARGAAQHRCHRQFGRRQHLRHGGQHQDRVEHPGARWPPADERPQRAAGADDRRNRHARTPQQLSADAGHIALTAARHGRFRLSAAAHADAGGARSARSRRRVSARRHGARRAPSPLAAVHAAGTLGFARLCQAHALRRPARIGGAGRSLPRPRTQPLFSEGDRRAISRCAATPPAAPRDHRHPARQLDDQPRRTFADCAHCRSDRGCARRRRFRLCRSARQLRHDRAQRRDRRARQPHCRQSAARSLRGSGRPFARPRHLVFAQCRSDQGTGGCRGALS